jgi:hypothetical protein
MTAIRETMRSHELHAIQLAALSPAARAVYERLVSGTYEIDLERLADALLARFETASSCCSRAAAVSGAESLAAVDGEGDFEEAELAVGTAVDLDRGAAVDPEGAACADAGTGEEGADDKA